MNLRGDRALGDIYLEGQKLPEENKLNANSDQTMDFSQREADSTAREEEGEDKKPLESSSPNPTICMVRGLWDYGD